MAQIPALGAALMSDDLPGETALSDVQIEILALVADGWTDERIALHLGLSTSTVQRRIRAASQFLGVTSRVGVGILAVLLELVEVPPSIKAAMRRHGHRFGNDDRRTR